MRRYQGFMADSSRWERFALRDDDIVISTPSKCGTTWMQNIVGMLVLDRPVLDTPISTLSPWLDMLVRTDEEVFGLLEAQQHRRWIKTHTPLDGLPVHPTVTYLTVIRHPLDVALSDRDHRANQNGQRAHDLRLAAAGPPGPPTGRGPDDAAGYLRWFIDNDLPPTGSGPHGLADFCEQVTTYWTARQQPNVHLFHYQDLWDDLDGEMRRVAECLGVTIDERRWPAFVEAATLDSMRSRAADAQQAPTSGSGTTRRASSDPAAPETGRRFSATSSRRTSSSASNASPETQPHGCSMADGHLAVAPRARGRPPTGARGRGAPTPTRGRCCRR